MTQADVTSVACEQFKFVNVTGNDTDPEGNYPLSLVSVVMNFGSASAVVDSATSLKVTGGYSPGSSQATYTVQDSLGAISTGILTITTTNPCF